MPSRPMMSAIMQGGTQPPLGAAVLLIAVGFRLCGLGTLKLRLGGC